jgi:tetratricopeptide (TPR) repeat protein
VGIAAGNIEKYADGSTSWNARAALGVALIVEGDLDRAITELEAAANELGTRQPNPIVHTNLSAAYLARARWGNHPEDWSKALAAADQAIQIEMNVPEPYFNRALALEGLGQTEDAAKAWAAYALRDRDSNSGWTREAEERRKALSAHQP